MMGRTERKKRKKWLSPLRVALADAKATAKQNYTYTICFTIGVVSVVKKFVSVVMKGR
jgi:hypothetical protein